MEEVSKGNIITVQENATPVPALSGSEQAGSRASSFDDRSVAGVADLGPATSTATSAGKQPNSVEELQLKIKLEELGVETRLNELEVLISEIKGVAAKYSNFSRDIRNRLDRAGLLMGDLRLHREALKEVSTLLKQLEKEKRRAAAADKIKNRTLGEPAGGIVSTAPNLK